MLRYQVPRTVEVALGDWVEVGRIWGLAGDEAGTSRRDYGKIWALKAAWRGLRGKWSGRCPLRTHVLPCGCDRRVRGARKGTRDTSRGQAGRRGSRGAGGQLCEPRPAVLDVGPAGAAPQECAEASEQRVDGAGGALRADPRETGENGGRRSGRGGAGTASRSGPSWPSHTARGSPAERGRDAAGPPPGRGPSGTAARRDRTCARRARVRGRGGPGWEDPGLSAAASGARDTQCRRRDRPRVDSPKQAGQQRPR